MGRAQMARPGRKQGRSRGRRSLVSPLREEFAIRLRSLILERFKTLYQFEKHLLGTRAKVSWSTIKGWLPPEEKFVAGRCKKVDWEEICTPDLAPLKDVADVLDVSVDYLLGYDVPKRRTDREPVGELATGLLRHVVLDYEHRPKKSLYLNRRRDGLAQVVGGTLLNGQPTPTPAERGDPWPSVEIGDVLAKGIIVNRLLLSGLQILAVDPQAFLASVCEHIAQDADTWELEHREEERRSVVDDIAKLLPEAAEIANALREETLEAASEAIVNRRLARAALEPLDPRSQADVLLFAKHLAKTRARRTAQEANTRQLTETISQLVAAELNGATMPEPKAESRQRHAVPSTTANPTTAST